MGRPAIHGDLSPETQLRLEEALQPGVELINLAVNINPKGPPHSVLEAISSCQLGDYPDPTAKALRMAFGQRMNLAPERIVFGNGATELLWSLARCLASPSQATLIIEPTFSEYARAAEACGAQVHSFWLTAESNFIGNASDIATVARRVNASSVYLCRPNNPTGTAMPFDELEKLATELNPTSLVLDESFLSLSLFASEARQTLPANVIRVRSLTKEYAIPGLRIGYLVTTAEGASTLEANRPPWTTSATAQAAGRALLDESAYLEQSRKELLEGSIALHSGLDSFGLRALTTSTIFSLVEVGDGAQFRSQLLRNGIVVRDTASFGLPSYVRIAAGAPYMRKRLWNALTKAGTSSRPPSTPDAPKQLP